MQMKDKVFVVTGGARGLGRAMAQQLVAGGARVALIDLDGDRLGQTARDIGSSAMAVPANVADEASVAAAFDAIEREMGAPAGVVNNAGITRDGLLVKVRDGQVVDRMSLASWQAVIDVNLTGVFLCGREAATRMISAGTGGIIINIASISRHGNFGQTNYSAAKAGVAAMTVTWARELARYGIRCNSISPGFIGTEMVAAMPENARAKITGQVPAGRLGEPGESASAVQFLIENDYVNGRDISVDGGLRL